MSPWDRLLAKPACGHFVQLYECGDKWALINNVSLYFSEGLSRGEGALAIITPENRKLLVGELERSGIDICLAMREKRLLCLDAQETLSSFLVYGWPDWNRFEAVIGKAVHNLKHASSGPGFRAFGEMVDILWQRHQFAAALRLEHLWNKLLSRSCFSLYCAYEVNACEQKNGPEAMVAVFSAHTHVLPADYCVHSHIGLADVAVQHNWVAVKQRHKDCGRVV